MDGAKVWKIVYPYGNLFYSHAALQYQVYVQFHSSQCSLSVLAHLPQVQRDVEGWSSDSSHSSAQSTSARADDASSSSDTEEQTTRGSRSRRQSRTPIDSSDSDQDWAPSPAAVESDSQEDQPAARTPIKRYNNDHDKAWHVAQREPPREEAKPRDESTSESQPSTSRFKRPQFRSQRSYRRHNGSADT